MTSWLPDVNVWLALHSERHEHHAAALAWFDAVDENESLVFCRQTQLGLFRLLTNAAVMGEESLNQRQCWAIYEEWLGEGRAVLGAEPDGMEAAFRARTNATHRATKNWTDSYLAAFAETAHLRLVTFDKALAGSTNGALLLN
jgi:toxin-antitoxin system PIN domain toxin